jgi:hypothetical protein
MYLVSWDQDFVISGQIFSRMNEFILMKQYPKS